MCKCKRIELRTHNDRPHLSQQANSSYIVRTNSLHAMANVLAPLECWYYWTIETGTCMTENRLPCLLLRKRLGGPLSMACEHKALCASALGMHLHAWPPCLCTWPYCSDQSWAFREHILYALQVMIWTIQGNWLSKKNKYFLLYLVQEGAMIKFL